LVPYGYATAGFEFMQKNHGPRGTLEYNDPASGLTIHTSDISAIYVAGTDAYVFDHVVIGSQTYESHCTWSTPANRGQVIASSC